LTAESRMGYEGEIEGKREKNQKKRKSETKKKKRAELILV